RTPTPSLARQRVVTHASARRRTTAGRMVPVASSSADARPVARCGAWQHPNCASQVAADAHSVRPCHKSCPDGPIARLSWPGAHSTLGRGQGRPVVAMPIRNRTSSCARSHNKAWAESTADRPGPIRPAVRPDQEPVQLAVTQATVVALFRDYHPEKFSGQGDPRIVDEWIQGLELIFEVMDCPNRYRVICAQLQLTGDARLWWNAYWSMRPSEKEGCTWDRFKEMIREKYYPSYYRAEMERQFLSLKQGTRTVDEYEREFTRLRAF
ncbi:Unknown protein, partial [Striga hermonthica]